MDEARLAAIQAAAEGATEPPWTVETNWAVGLVIEADGDVICSDLHNGTGSRADAVFIALARSAVPELLAHVGVLQADNQRLRDANQHLQWRVIAAGSLLNEGTYDHDRDDPCKCSSCLTLRLLREPFEAVSDGD